MKSLMATNNHYIYSLTDPRDGVVRYIGQGQGRRYEWCRYPKSDCQYGVHPWLQRNERHDERRTVVSHQ